MKGLNWPLKYLSFFKQLLENTHINFRLNCQVCGLMKTVSGIFALKNPSG